MKAIISLFCTLGMLFQMSAQDTLSPIIFIYDASGSMWGQIEGQTKMQIASSVLSNAVDSLSKDQNVGLVAYGHRKKGDCKDVEFLVEMDNGDKSRITTSLEKIKPLGKTPLAYSAKRVIDTLSVKKKKATIILITDGIESCGGNICDVVRAARERGIDFKLHIIGFGLKDDETDQLKCAALAGGGQYYDAADAGDLGEVLHEATEATVDKPEKSLSVFAVKNGKPIDAYIKVYLVGTKEWSQSARTYKDTAFLHPSPGTYDLEIKPLGNSDVNALVLKGVECFKDSIVHQTVSFDGGKINVITLNNGEGWDAVVTVYNKITGKSAARGRTYGRSDVYEVNPGLYDVEVKALVIKGLDIIHRIENVEVKANETIDVEHNFKSGVVMIGASSDDGLVDAVVNIRDLDNKKSVANGRTYTRPTNNPKKFVLNPGKYTVTLSALGDFKGKKETFTIEVKEGETVEKITKF